MINSYLEKLGLNDKERKLYLTLAEIGIQPASVIAKKCGLDRVTAYKNLKKLVNKGFLKIYYQNNIQAFGIENFSNLEFVLQEKLQTLNDLQDKLPLIKNSLQTLTGKQSYIPKLQIFEGETGIKNLLRDILFEIKDNSLKQLRMLVSNTFEERLGDVPLSKFVSDFFKNIKKQNIDVEIFEAQGQLIPEVLKRLTIQNFDPEKLPAAHGTTNIFIAGNAVYLACYKTSPIGLKIKHPEISQMFHFLFDIAGKTSGNS